MSTDRYQNLIGYQIIKAVNTGQHCVKSLADVMQNKIVFTDRAATLEDLKMMVDTNCRIIDTEIKDRVHNFTTLYPDTDNINTGLGKFSETPLKVGFDKVKIENGDDISISTSLTATTIKELENTGKSLDTVKWDVAHKSYVHDDIPYNYQTMNTYQNVLNALAVELQGLNIYTGELLYDTFEKIKFRADKRIITADRLWSETYNSDDINLWRNEYESIKTEYKKATDVKKLSEIGIYLDSVITQLPCIWKHWYYK